MWTAPELLGESRIGRHFHILVCGLTAAVHTAIRSQCCWTVFKQRRGTVRLRCLHAKRMEQSDAYCVRLHHHNIYRATELGLCPKRISYSTRALDVLTLAFCELPDSELVIINQGPDEASYSAASSTATATPQMDHETRLSWHAVTPHIIRLAGKVADEDKDTAKSEINRRVTDYSRLRLATGQPNKFEYSEERGLDKICNALRLYPKWG